TEAPPAAPAPFRTLVRNRARRVPPLARRVDAGQLLRVPRRRPVCEQAPAALREDGARPPGRPAALEGDRHPAARNRPLEREADQIEVRLPLSAVAVLELAGLAVRQGLAAHERPPGTRLLARP